MMNSVDAHGGGRLGNPQPPQHSQQQQHYAQQPHYTQQPQQQSSPQRQRSGPRAQCDQVVFEAIAKAAEIVVASRCKIDSDPSSSPPSGRFNLLVPEVKSVRDILQRWKRTMHIPLRLDVYYQHPPPSKSQNNNNHEAAPTFGERELLERWCLEYAPSQSQLYDEQYGLSSHVDPIVQLRQVCKNIVVWLRTLYCHSRLLPAQALRKHHSHHHNNNCIGFSIYVVGDGQDDVSGLVQQGFDTEPKQQQHGSGSSGVLTPYGELGWRVYLAPRELVRRLLALEQEKARLFQQQYANTTSIPRSIPMKVVQQQQSQQPQNAFGTNSGGAQPVARSAPTHNRGYRRANSDSVAAHSPSQQLKQQYQFQQQQPPEQPRYYSRSPSSSRNGAPSTLLAPRSYHPQGGSLRRIVVGDHNPNSTRGLYPNDAAAGDNNPTPLSTTPNNESSDSPASSGKGGINPNKNLSALSLALLSMKTDTDSSSPDPSESDAAADLGPTEIRRAALHNAPPCAATGVGEYGYAYNNHSHPYPQQSQQQNTQQQTQTQQTPNLSSSPASIKTPVSSTFGTTPPGYLLSATPRSYGVSGNLVPPARPSSAGSGIAPPFVRPLGFAGQATASTAGTSTTNQPSPQSATQQLQSPAPPQQLGAAATTPEEQKPSLDLLHSSPFHHSAMGGHYHPNGSGNQQSSQQQKDGLSSFLQAEENASIEAATTFINDFYHHHYPMASLTTADHDHHHHHHHSGMAGEDYHHHHHHSSGMFAAELSSAAFLDDVHHQQEDMPFAVEGISSGSTPTNQASSLLKHNTTSGGGGGGMSTHEASLMAASMMVPHKKLALFGNSSDADNDKAAATAAGGGDDMDALTDQLADFRSFGATLASPLTTSVGSGG